MTIYPWKLNLQRELNKVTLINKYRRYSPKIKYHNHQPHWVTSTSSCRIKDRHSVWRLHPWYEGRKGLWFFNISNIVTSPYDLTISDTTSTTTLLNCSFLYLCIHTPTFASPGCSQRCPVGSIKSKVIYSIAAPLRHYQWLGSHDSENRHNHCSQGHKHNNREMVILT